MKIFIPVLLLFPAACFCQEFKMISTDEPHKVFTDGAIKGTYSMALQLQETDPQTQTSKFYNYNTVRQEAVEENNCGFWGPPHCLKQDQPSWLGKYVESKNGACYFHNVYNEVLSFDLDNNTGQPFTFYENDREKFEIVYERTENIGFHDFADVGRYYVIRHKDSNNMPINSPLNGRHVVIGKQLGLIQFFQVDSFPVVLKPLYLVGHDYNDLGINKITGAFIHDYQPGDEIQREKQAFRRIGGSPSVTRTFTKHVIISRSEQGSDHTYMVRREVFGDGIAFAVDTFQLTGSHDELISGIPLETHDLVTRQLSLEKYCGQELFTYRVKDPNDRMYCEEANCWGSKDIFADPFSYDITYVAGLGVYSSMPQSLKNGPDDIPPATEKVIYFKKNGASCGNEMSVGIDEFTADGVTARVNSEGNLTVEAPYQFKRMTIHDISGRQLFTDKIQGESIVDLSKMATGHYYLRLESDGGPVVVKQFIRI